MSRREWLNQLATKALELQKLAHRCPHCKPKGYCGCALCQTVWYVSELLMTFTRLVRQVEVPEDITE